MFFWWMKRKRNPEQDLETLTRSLGEALGERLKSVVVFGSLASGEFNPERSNVNVLVIADVPMDALQRLGPALQHWVKQGHQPPVLAEPDELPALARDFPIEFLDMRDSHRVLWGGDPLKDLSVDRQYLRAQCEHDLALLRLRLRQTIGAAGGDDRKIHQALTASLSSVLTLLRAAVRLDEDGAKLDKMKAVERIAARAGFDASVLRQVKDLRPGDPLQNLAARYLEIIDKALQYLRA
jgi:predicted nucleotidyltransferase